MRWFLASLALVAIIALEGQALAGVVGSPHDIAAQKYTVLGRQEEKRNVCNYCHVPHKAKGAALWPTLPPSLTGWGKVGALCYSCHDGVAIANPNVDASNTAFNPRSHGLKLSNLPDGDSVRNSGLPYTNGEQDTIECSTCHNPHDDTYRPFIRAPLTELCQKCHLGRENSGYAINNVEGTHPVHKLPKDEVEGPSPIWVADEFKTPLPLPYPSEDGRYTEGVHWTLGGKLSGGNDGTIECVTCHSVHGRERIGPTNDRLLSMDPVKQDADLFCEGCHRGKRADGIAEPPYPNPGGTTLPRTYHPADNDSCNGPGRLIEIKEPQGWEFGKGGEVLCSTCHKAHRALKGSPILRPPTNGGTFCEECHSVPFPHHPTGQYGGGEVNSGKPHAKTRQVMLPPDFSPGYTYGQPRPNSLYCSSCHRAHNASCSPILALDCTQGDSCAICTSCHPKFNPTWQTDDNYKSTHFMGNPTLATIPKVTVTGMVFGTQDGYYDQYPPVNKDPWPESHLKSYFGGPDGNEINCCSCHSFAVGNISAGNADQAPYLGPILAPGFQPNDLTTGLLARAGSYKEWLASDVFKFEVGGERESEEKVSKYLCTGCHGLTPNSHPGGGGEGFTHPLMDADGSNLKPIPPANLTYNKHVNCESCHSPHEADSNGGFYILNKVDKSTAPGVNTTGGIPDPYAVMKRTQIEFAPLCQLCHIGY